MSWISVSYLLGSSIFLPFVWEPVELLMLLGMLAIGALGMLCQLTALAAYRAAPIPIVSSFDYLAVVWAMLAGYLIWKDALTLQMLVGSGLIVAGGILIAGSLRSRFGTSG